MKVEMSKNERKKRENIGCHRKKPCEYECGLRMGGYLT